MKTIISFLIGSTVGALVGVLLAPRSGKKTQKMIAKEAKKLRKEFESQANARLAQAKSSLNDTVEQQAERSKNSIDRVKDKLTV